MSEDISRTADLTEKGLSEIRIDKLRDAVCKNQVSFPSQVPTFSNRDRPDLQPKLVQLYFVRQWSCAAIGARYGLSRSRVLQVLKTWAKRAVELGYIQCVPPAGTLQSSFENAPIHVVLSPVASAMQPPAPPVELSPPPLDGNRIPKTDSPRSRPRRRFETAQIVCVLKELEEGRSLTSMAKELGVSTAAIRAWKEQQAMLSLRLENAHLKERLANLSAMEKI